MLQSISPSKPIKALGMKLWHYKEISVSKYRVERFSMSIDGFSAGPNRSLENPLDVAGFAPHEWPFLTAMFSR